MKKENGQIVPEFIHKHSFLTTQPNDFSPSVLDYLGEIFFDLHSFSLFIKRMLFPACLFADENRLSFFDERRNAFITIYGIAHCTNAARF